MCRSVCAMYKCAYLSSSLASSLFSSLPHFFPPQSSLYSFPSSSALPSFYYSITSRSSPSLSILLPFCLYPIPPSFDLTAFLAAAVFLQRPRRHQPHFKLPVVNYRDKFSPTTNPTPSALNAERPSSPAQQPPKQRNERRAHVFRHVRVPVSVGLRPNDKAPGCVFMGREKCAIKCLVTFQA